MKNSFIKILGTTFLGGAIGALTVFAIYSKSNPTIQTASLNETKPVVEKQFVKPVVNSPFTAKTEESNRFANLTPASEKGAETVVHITTEFVSEEVTYDPFMKLFYGEEAYRTQKRRGMASGSGVIVSPEGYIVTNNHVVKDAEKIDITINEKTYKGELIGTDPSTDLAVVKINKKHLPYLEFANSDDIRLGEWVLAIGNPLNLQTTITAGIVSAKNRNIDLLTKNYDPEKNIFPVESFIQTDAAVNSGNSGGALVNQNGDLIGINTAIASGNGFYTGYSFAIPSNIVKKVTYDLIQFGEVKRVQLGINIMENNSQVAQENSLSTDRGILITDIIEGGNASKADLHVKDIILSVESKKIKSIAELQAELIVRKPGDRVRIGVLRGQEEKLIDVLLE